MSLLAILHILKVIKLCMTDMHHDLFKFMTFNNLNVKFGYTKYFDYRFAPIMDT